MAASKKPNLAKYPLGGRFAAPTLYFQAETHSLTVHFAAKRQVGALPGMSEGVKIEIDTKTYS